MLNSWIVCAMLVLSTTHFSAAWWNRNPCLLAFLSSALFRQRIYCCVEWGPNPELYSAHDMSVRWALLLWRHHKVPSSTVGRPYLWCQASACPALPGGSTVAGIVHFPGGVGLSIPRRGGRAEQEWEQQRLCWASRPDKGGPCLCASKIAWSAPFPRPLRSLWRLPNASRIQQ